METYAILTVAFNVLLTAATVNVRARRNLSFVESCIASASEVKIFIQPDDPTAVVGLTDDR